MCVYVYVWGGAEEGRGGEERERRRMDLLTK
jgi:hypothetical protein